MIASPALRAHPLRRQLASTSSTTIVAERGHHMSGVGRYSVWAPPFSRDSPFGLAAWTRGGAENPLNVEPTRGVMGNTPRGSADFLALRRRSGTVALRGLPVCMLGRDLLFPLS